MRVGVFDSGVGGITVLLELKRQIPEVEFVYLGDTANVPYGAKSPAHIAKLSRSCARRLKKCRIDALVVACNTASSLALEEIKKVMGTIPVFSVVEPGVEAALTGLKAIRAACPEAPVLVLATRATIKSGAYGRLLSQVLGSARVVEQACPLLVPLIEEGWVDHPVLHQIIKEYVAPYIDTDKPGVALLACTHYPWIIDAFRAALPGWWIVNSAEAIAQAVAEAQIVPKASKKRRRPQPIEWIFTDPEAVPGFARAWIVANSR